MTLPYRIRREAEADLNEAFHWYESRREGLGADFLLCFEEALQKVRRNPDIYPRVHKNVRRGWIRRFPQAASHGVGSRDLEYTIFAYSQLRLKAHYLFYIETHYNQKETIR